MDGLGEDGAGDGLGVAGRAVDALPLPGCDSSDRLQLRRHEADLPIDARMARRVLHWTINCYPVVFGTKDAEVNLREFLTQLWLRRERSNPKGEVEACVAALAGMGCFEIYRGVTAFVRGTTHVKRPVMKIRPVSENLRKVDDILRYGLNEAKDPTVRDRPTGQFVPNLLFHALRDGGVPPDERKAAAYYIIDTLVKPYLVGLGFDRPRPDLEELHRPTKALAAAIARANAAAAAPEQLPVPANSAAPAWVPEAAPAGSQPTPATDPAPSEPPSASAGKTLQDNTSPPSEQLPPQRLTASGQEWPAPRQERTRIGSAMDLKMKCASDKYAMAFMQLHENGMAAAAGGDPVKAAMLYARLLVRHRPYFAAFKGVWLESKMTAIPYGEAEATIRNYFQSAVKAQDLEDEVAKMPATAATEAAVAEA